MNVYLLAGLVGFLAVASMARAGASKQINNPTNRSSGAFWNIKKRGAEMALNKPRGIRNNNAGNIRHGAAWQGMDANQPDRSFITFIAPEYGLRAIGRILRTYQQKYGLNTIRGVITRWAPPTENNTTAYVDAVVKHVGASADAPLDFTKKAVLIPMLEAITRHENGQQPYNIALLNKAAVMAGATA